MAMHIRASAADCRRQVCRLKPTAAREREPVLDALRGFAIFGILLVNIEVMRGPDWLVLMGGGSAPEAGLTDNLVQFVVGWLATGKFISSLAILFGVGAALIAARALRAGESPRPLLARRYAWLMVFGIGHMLLYPGDILFLYGLTGLALLAFVMLPLRAILSWSAAILAAFTALGLRYWAADDSRYDDEAAADSLDSSIDEVRAETVAAFATGSWGDMLAAHVSQSLLLQSAQLFVLPWVLALFLFGFAITRAGILGSLGAHRALLRRGAFMGLAVGLPANIVLGFAGPLSGFSGPAETEPIWMTRWTVLAQLMGAPVLAVGYLCAVSLLCVRGGANWPLVAVGRMALTAYLLQSALALAVFGGLRLYDQLSSTSALLLVAGIWAVVLVICPLWLRWFQLGPAEWLWRSLTYGRAQAMRTQRDVS